MPFVRSVIVELPLADFGAYHKLGNLQLYFGYASVGDGC